MNTCFHPGAERPSSRAWLTAVLATVSLVVSACGGGGGGGETPPPSQPPGSGAPVAPPVTPPPAPDFGPAAVITAGGEHTCVVTQAGAVACWGDNRQGQLGNGTRTDSSTPVAVQGLAAGSTSTQPGSIAAGDHHTCAITVAGPVVCWGNDGSSVDAPNPAPVAIADIDDAVALSAGAFHTCAVRTGGGVKCWGSGASGQLGNDTKAFSATAVGVFNLPPPNVSIGMGAGFGCAADARGAVACWGDNRLHQLGTTREFTNAAVPQPALLDNVLALAAGRDHSCALISFLPNRNHVTCWGDNTFLQRGAQVPDLRDDNLVAGLDLDANLVATSGGAEFHCALGAAGSVQCWGLNNAAQIGIDPDDPAAPVLFPPTFVPGLETTPLAAIDAGGAHTCGITTTGSVKCWGFNSRGQGGQAPSAFVRVSGVAGF